MIWKLQIALIEDCKSVQWKMYWLVNGPFVFIEINSIAWPGLNKRPHLQCLRLLWGSSQVREVCCIELSVKSSVMHWSRALLFFFCGLSIRLQLVLISTAGLQSLSHSHTTWHVHVTIHTALYHRVESGCHASSIFSIPLCIATRVFTTCKQPLVPNFEARGSSIGCVIMLCRAVKVFTIFAKL